MRLIVKYVFCVVLVLASCKTKIQETEKAEVEKEITFDLNEIKQRGKLKVVTDYNSTNYFIYKGRPMGYQLELLEEFCNNIGIKLEVLVSNDVHENIEDLRSGRIDLIAQNLTVTRERSKTIQFTEPHSYSRQVLVQRVLEKPDSVRKSRFNPVIRNQLELAGENDLRAKGIVVCYPFEEFGR